jgi:hypothetical protein
MVAAMIWMIVLGGLFGAGVVLVARAMAGKHSREVSHCSNCNAPIPFLRRSWSLRQVMWGGYTCLACGSEFDAYGGDIAPRVKNHIGEAGSL